MKIIAIVFIWSFITFVIGFIVGASFEMREYEEMEKRWREDSERRY